MLDRLQPEAEREVRFADSGQAEDQDVLAVLEVVTGGELLRTCWGKVLAGKAGFTSSPGCPVTDAKTVAKLA